MNAHHPRAVVVMAEATSWFVSDPYATEALDALDAAGWTLLPPEDDRLEELDASRLLLHRIATADYRGPEPEARHLARRHFATWEEP